MMTMEDFWNSQFKFSEILPDFAQSLSRMTADSAAVSDSREFHRAAYGSHQRQWVEWTSGSGSEGVLPVILHGGYWRALDAETHRFMIPAFQAHGAVVANVEYRLMPEVRLADVVADTVAALQELARQFPSARLVLIGHSAGAHLALCTLRDPEVAARTRGVIALSGIYDLAPVARSFLQEELQLTQDEIDQFSLKPDSAPVSVLYVNGSAETHEYLRGGALMAKGKNAAWHVINAADHMSLTWAACARSDALLSSLFEMEQA
jgi:arylformamidase